MVKYDLFLKRQIWAFFDLFQTDLILYSPYWIIFANLYKYVKYVHIVYIGI